MKQMNQMKQIRKLMGSLLLSVCMVFTMLPTVAFAEEGVLVSGDDWEIDSSGLLTITTDEGMSDWISNKYNNTDGIYNKYLVTTLWIDNSVTTVPESVFSYCENLTTVTSWGGVTEIETKAFDSSGLTTIDLTGSSVEIIGDNAFRFCSELTTVSGWGTQLTTLGYSFQACHNLTSIAELPASVTNIDTDLFLRAGVTFIGVNSGNPNFSTSAAGALLNKAGDTLLIFPEGKIGSYRVETGITAIGDWAFSNTRLTSLTIPQAVDTIGNYAFASCDNLTTVTFEGDILPTIGLAIFFESDALTGIYVPVGSENAYKTALANYADKVQSRITNSTELKSALEATTAQIINVTMDITIADNITVGADHTLNIADGCTLSTGEETTLTIPVNKTLALTGTGTFKVNNKIVYNGVDVKGNLTSNGIHIIVANYNLNGISLDSGAQMQVHGGKLDMENTGTSGIFGDGTLSVNENCQVTIKNVKGGAGATTYAVISNFSVKNSTVQIQNTEYCTGIELNSGMNLTMDNAVINVTNIGDGSYGLWFNDNVNITADTNSKLILSEGAALYGLANKLSDQGIVLTENERVTVGAKDATPSADGLTAGMYTWNGSAFAKAKSSTTVNNTSESSNKTVVSYVPYVPTAPEEISRYSYKGRETVAFSAVSNPSKVSLTMNNSIQGTLFFDSIAYVLGDNKIGRTYNIFANKKTEPTDQPVTITLSIPEELRKQGRTFKMIGVLKNGMPYVLEDMDADDKTITITTNHFYGFALVYSDK